MNLMISEITSPLTPATTPRNGFVETISYATSECSLGQVLIARSAKGVCAILIGADRDELEADLAAHFPKARLVENEAVVHDDLTKVNKFWTIPPKDFVSRLICEGRRFSAMSGRSFAQFPLEEPSRIPTSPIGSDHSPQPAQSLALAPPIRLHWPFHVTAWCATTAIWRATAGASSASVK